VLCYSDRLSPPGEGYENLVGPAIDNVIAFLDGQPQHLVNAEVLAQRHA